jgi:energy-coupling factor transporter transmembrane protein EcfT
LKEETIVAATFLLDNIGVIIVVVLILLAVQSWRNKEYMTVFTSILIASIFLVFSNVIDKEFIGKLGAYLLDGFGLIDNIEKHEIIEAIDEQVKKASENNQETTWQMIGLAFKSALPQDWKQFNESINSGDFYAAVITSIVTILAFTFTNISNSKSQRFGAYGSIVRKTNCSLSRNNKRT